MWRNSKNENEKNLVAPFLLLRPPGLIGNNNPGQQPQQLNLGLNMLHRNSKCANNQREFVPEWQSSICLKVSHFVKYSEEKNSTEAYYETSNGPGQIRMA